MVVQHRFVGTVEYPFFMYIWSLSDLYHLEWFCTSTTDIGYHFYFNAYHFL